MSSYLLQGLVLQMLAPWNSYRWFFPQRFSCYDCNDQSWLQVCFHSKVYIDRKPEPKSLWTLNLKLDRVQEEAQAKEASRLALENAPSASAAETSAIVLYQTLARNWGRGCRVEGLLGVGARWG